MQTNVSFLLRCGGKSPPHHSSQKKFTMEVISFGGIFSAEYSDLLCKSGGIHRAV
nr:MAG TPA: hypothetical protein [Caudoviricetes sp.]